MAVFIFLGNYDIMLFVWLGQSCVKPSCKLICNYANILIRGKFIALKTHFVNKEINHHEYADCK